MNRSDTLHYLATVDINELVGGLIEQFCEEFTIAQDLIPVFERFLASSNLDNRSIALTALVACGKYDGYEADAILLHFDGRYDVIDTPEAYASIEFLKKMAERGSKVAIRTLNLLRHDPYVRRLFPDTYLDLHL